MSSLISGYNYDIFISYRQKDNKHDGWVTEFVDNLKGELESAFKEQISVYFDINPSDYLLESYDVDASLRDKLKCLVFIPIISRTYCDSKSFAWEHEFKAFVNQASQDQFGLKVKLPNGNVANRVLPVRIYDLDTTDTKQCESVMGGVMRGIEFIYKEPGVNKPLTGDDDEKKNLNGTKYRIQINKVANAIKEVITALEQHEQKPEEVQKEISRPVSVSQKNNKTKILAGSIIVLVLIILGLFLIPKLVKPEAELEKSIAVLPFTNLSNDPEQEYFSDGIVEAILNHLFKIGELKVISSTSTKRYKNTELSLKEIARELGVASILEGSVQKIGNNIRITTQLIEAKTDVHLWSEIYDRDISDIFAIQSEVAQNVARELKATLTSEEREQIKKNQTENPEAYNLYLQGYFHIKKRTNEGYKKSIEYFGKAVALDPDYALAYAGLADAYFLLAWYNLVPKPEGYAKSKEYVNKALGIDKNLAEAHTVLGTVLCWNEWKWEEARKELQLAVELNPNFIHAHSYYAELLEILRENSDARKQMNIALELDPFFPMMSYLSGRLYFDEGKYNESLDEFRKRREITSDSIFEGIEFHDYIGLGEDLKAVEVLEKVFLKSSDTLIAKNAVFLKDVYNKAGLKGLRNWLIELELKRPSPDPWSLAERYAAVGKKEEALLWLEKLFENPPSSLPRINNIPGLEILRSEPRFQALIAKLGLSEYQTPK